MFAARLPEEVAAKTLVNRLYENHRIEAPIILWKDRPFIRVSVQGYNDQNDIDALLEGLEEYPGSKGVHQRPGRISPVD